MRTLLFVLLVLLAALPAAADEIVLKTGATIEGVVLREDDKQVVVRAVHGEMTLERSRIERIVRGGLTVADIEAQERAAQEAAEAERAGKSAPGPRAADSTLLSELFRRAGWAEPVDARGWGRLAGTLLVAAMVSVILGMPIAAGLVRVFGDCDPTWGMCLKFAVLSTVAGYAILFGTSAAFHAAGVAVGGARTGTALAGLTVVVAVAIANAVLARTVFRMTWGRAASFAVAWFGAGVTLNSMLARITAG